MKGLAIYLLGLILLTLQSAKTMAQTSLDQVNYTGRLVTNTGAPVAGPVNLIFRLFVDGTEKCRQTVTGVDLNNGVFNVELTFPNSGAPEYCDSTNNTLKEVLQDAHQAGDKVFLEVEDTSNTQIYSQQALTAAPYAMVASMAITASSANTASTALALDQLSANDGEYLRWDGGLGRWIPDIVTASGPGSGTVTQIDTGNGLVGGPINVSGTISADIDTTILDFTGDGKITLQDNAVGDSKIASGISGLKIATGSIPLSRIETTVCEADGTNCLVNSAGSGIDITAGIISVSASSCLANQVSVFTGTGDFVCINVFSDAIADGVTNLAPTQNAVFNALATKLDLGGGTMTGPLNMGGEALTNLAAPAADNHAATRLYVNDQIDDRVNVDPNYVPRHDATRLVNGTIQDDGTLVGVGIAPEAGFALKVDGNTRLTGDLQVNGNVDIGCNRADTTDAANDGLVDIDVSCGAGQRALGGGVSCSTTDHILRNSYPLSDDTWRVSVERPTTGDCTAYAVCCRL